MPITEPAALPTPTSSDRRTAPADGVFLAFAAVAPVVAGAITALAVPADRRPPVVHATIVWTAAVLSFLGGVRRGDSFHTIGGPTILQLVAIFGSFGCALIALLSPWPILAIAVLLAGCGAAGLLDAVAARHAQAPRFFAGVRPPQMAVATIGLALLLIAALR